MVSHLRISLRNEVGGSKATNLTASESISDEMAMRKAEEAAVRRIQAMEWLKQMDRGAMEALAEELSEDDFCLALRNGLILCNVLNKVNPGAVSKVVDNPSVAVQSLDGATQSAIQYFENMRNFLVAVNEMKLLTFEASDLEKGGSSIKVVDCILCLKAYHEWKLSGGVGIWKYGGIVKISSSHIGQASYLSDSASSDETSQISDMIHNQQLLEALHLLAEAVLNDCNVATSLHIFDQFGIKLLQTLLTEWTDVGELSLNETLIDLVLEQAVKEFSTLIVSHKTQLRKILKRVMREGNKEISKDRLFKVVSKKFKESISISPSCCVCNPDSSNLEVLDFQHKQIEKLKVSFYDMKVQVESDRKKWEEDLQTIQRHVQGLESYASSYNKLLEENRILYNQVQELKGNIRVYCRVRPFLTNVSDGRSTVEHIGENGSIIIKNHHNKGRDARKVFSFNKVFGMNARQSEVFADTKPLIRSVMDGYNVCIFAYGQTGSGKTYTMSGADLSKEETWGVNYRALNDLFHISKSRASTIVYDVNVQMIEIYNEQVRDLLVTDGCDRRLEIRNNSQVNGLNIPDANLVAVRCTEDVLGLMKLGLANRSVGATVLNQRSSRSHSVLTIHVQGKELASGSILRGCLHLVDLAGSERVDKSEATGDRLKEAQHINRSLSALGDVISALAQKNSHIPYRNSKLTQVLQDALGGQAKTLMFVHINPEIDAFGETISTLKFAERVASIELGAARINKETGKVTELKEEISRLRSVLEYKELEVQKLKEYSSKIVSEMYNHRKASPILLQSYFSIMNSNYEDSPGLLSDSRNVEISNNSSGKQRKPHYRMPFLNKDFIDKEIETSTPLSAGESCTMNSRKIRSRSPSIRSISTDRASIIKSKPRIQTSCGKPIQKVQFPEPPSITKSSASISTDSTSDIPRYRFVQDLDSSRRILLDNEDQPRQTLISRKNMMEIMTKHQKEPQNSDSDTRGLAENIEFSEVENICNNPVESLLNISGKVKKFQPHVTTISQSIESRSNNSQVPEPFSRGKHENNPPNRLANNGKERNDITEPDIRHSRSLSRGKFILF